MTIRDKDIYAKRSWDWGFLNDCFRYDETHITMGDVDGIVERNGKFLVLEGKPASWSPSQSDGQLRLLKALSREPNFTVIIVWGDPETSIVTHMRVLREGIGPKHVATNEDVQSFVSDWFAKANGE